MKRASAFVPQDVIHSDGHRVPVLFEVTVDMEKAAKCLAQKAYDAKRRKRATTCFGALVVAVVQS